MSQVKEKTKVRFTSLDITALVRELKDKLVGMRVTNIYDLSNKMYMFKMGSSENKQQFIIENGIRFHTTTEEIKTKATPSAFTMKFRKFIRSKRLEDIRQVGVERVVVLTFGSFESQNHLIIELYSQGNILLTDKDYKIIQLIRSHQFTEDVKTGVGEIYPFDYAATLYLEKFDVSKESVEKILAIQKKEDEEEEEKQKEFEKQQKEKEKNEDDFMETVSKKKAKKMKQQDQEEVEEEKGKNDKNQKNQKNQKKKTQKKGKQEKEKKFKDIIFKLVPSLHQPVIDHVITTLGFDINKKCGVEDIQDLQKAAEECIQLTKNIQSKRSRGYLVVSDKSKQKLEEKKEDEKKEGGDQKELTEEEKKKQQLKKEFYFDFTPVVLCTHQGKEIREMISFNDAIDKYFQRLSTKQVEEVNQQNNQGQGKGGNKESIILKKFNNIIKDQDARIQALQSEQQISERKAQLIEMNIDDVDAIANIVKAMKQGGISWDKIYKMINEAKEDSDPLANIISDMDFDKNRVSILVEDPEADITDEMYEVEIDIYENAYANARAYYQNRKFNARKEVKTQEAKDIALKQAEITAQREIEKNQIKSTAVANRKTYWFEKFYWFITSENYLVLSGRDAAQNEILMKKYMRKGDIYMHADYHGSSSTIIKNPTPAEPIPQQTLEEAAQASACRSKAWDNKILPTVYWVYDHQVSKKAETGEYLPHGSFMIRGKKNFIRPMRLEMGVVMLFKVDDSCIERHKQDRVVKGKDEDDAKSLQLEKDLSLNPQMSNDIDSQEFPSYATLKQQSSIYSQQQQEQEDKQVSIVSMLPQNNKNIKSHQKGQQNQQQKLKQQQGQNKQQQQQGGGGKQQQQQGKKGSKIVEQLKKGQKLSKKQLEKLYKEQEEEENNQDKDHTVNVPRGKANKIRKMKKKYGDQTEEEREVKMQLLGSKQVQGFDWEVQNQQQEKKFNPNKIKEEEEEEKEEQEEKENNEEKQENLLKENETEQNNNENEQKQEKDKDKEEEEKQKEDKKEEVEEEEEEDEEESKQDKEDEEKEKALEEQRKAEKYEEEETQMNQELAELTKLVSYLLPEDNFSNMVFMCAPYNTLQILKCKFRVKLVTGSSKKGKSGREIIQFFQGQKESSQKDKQIMKSITDKEVIDQMIGNCKINAAGLLKMKMGKKQEKKQQKKAQDKAEQQIKQHSLLY